MDIVKYLARYLTIPLFDKREGKTIGPFLKELRESQYYSPGKIRELQLSKLKDILIYADKHCSFYTRRFADCGFNPQSFSSFEDIKKIPILTKDDIRSNQEHIVSDRFKIKDLFYKRTGGSTSVPLKLYVDFQACDRKLAATLRHNSWANYNRGDKLAAIWGDTEREYSFKEKVYNYFNTRTIYLDTLLMSEDYNKKFIQKVRNFKPTVMMGHAHSLYALACFIEEHKIADLGIRGIISTAEILYEHERARIEKLFGKVLFNRYGCEELSIIASECDQHDGLHIHAEGLHVEVDGGDETNPGRLIITDLDNRGMPFIRYEIGDMATTKTGECGCGRGLPRLGKIYGRTADLLYTPDGRTISGISVLDTFTIHIPGVKQVQIIQDKLDVLNFKIVKNDDFNDKSLGSFKEKIPLYFGKSMKYNIEYVEKIVQTERGKYRFSICNIPQEKRGAKPL